MPRVGQMVLNPILLETDTRVLYKKEELKGVTENNLSRRAKLEIQLAVWPLAVPIHTYDAHIRQVSFLSMHRRTSIAMVVLIEKCLCPCQLLQRCNMMHMMHLNVQGPLSHSTVSNVFVFC